ncbi:hypothetical protein [Clostridium magnum]|uniref:Uncharacterized protein n=1 Tax=Clostridium magnum DSM 2767 TaxID=1121326 RepID=A0A161WY39_9CLOT|nr:hypothetical protein [Clostridium magnum]KZL91988.1 hypothetical protein CLMAG_17940 [Clostridium magnum DSM 2767]SHH27037.1 hydrogenase small subunit [Clostridium magnum DSM 2767]
MNRKEFCPVVQKKETTASNLTNMVLDELRNREVKKLNAIWVEATGCSGNRISLLNAKDPDMVY